MLVPPNLTIASMILSMARLSTAWRTSSATLIARRTTSRSCFRPRTMTTQRSLSNGSNNDDVDALLLGTLQIPVHTAIRSHGHNSVVFVDGSWWLPNNSARKARQEYEHGPRIAGAHFLDIDDIANKENAGLPHMLPPSSLHAAAMDSMRITAHTHIIVYGTRDCPYIHRAWYQLVALGHDMARTHWLDGDLRDWQALGGPVDDAPQPGLCAVDLDLTLPPQYPAHPAIPALTLQQVQSIIDEQQQQQDFLIVDARAPERFYGQVDEPRPGLRRGHMPGAKNVFFMNVLDAQRPTRMKDAAQVQQAFANAGVNVDTAATIVTTCGSGATACTLAAALMYLGRAPETIQIYDGSWMEWGARQDVPIAATDDSGDKR